VYTAHPTSIFDAGLHKERNQDYTQLMQKVLNFVKTENIIDRWTPLLRQKEKRKEKYEDD
jgi:hypothetical protein